MNAKLLFVHALSPLHAGTGQGVGVIDLPIAREKATGLPYLPGSSLKGCLRDLCDDADECVKVFGPGTSNADDHAGAAQFADQRLLLMPIRSLNGTFAWVTSPYLLQRLIRDAEDTEAKSSLPATVPQPTQTEECIVVSDDCAIKMVSGDEQQAILEELDLQVSTQQTADDWAKWLAEQIFPDDATWQQMLKARLCIVHDDALAFLLQTATEITARIKLLDDTKTVQEGGLWYEESLPTETILCGLVIATPVKATGLKNEEIFQVLEGLLGRTIQFGGNASVGRGLCRVQMV
jgi:CRISPR-associated protein Cmr4